MKASEIPTGDTQFWNSKSITTYFSDKPPDPRIKEFILSHSFPKGSKALDLGCGGGRHTELLAEHGFKVCAIDINPEMIKTTKNRLKELHLEAEVSTGSILDIPYPDNTFDLVVTTGVLHQAMSSAEYASAVSELARAMKPGGHVLLNIFTRKAWDKSYEVISEDGNTVRTKENVTMTLLSRDGFLELMSGAGLQLIDEQGEDIKEENTGVRSVFRAFFRKASK